MMIRRSIVVLINTAQKLRFSCIRVMCVQPSSSFPNCDRSNNRHRGMRSRITWLVFENKYSPSYRVEVNQ